MFAGVLGTVFLLAGPRARVDTDPPEWEARSVPTAPQELEAWLDASEAALGDVLPHAAKTVVWADPARPTRTDRVVVYLHGFSATRQETRPLADSVAARLGANLYYPRLRGHGRPGSALGQVRGEDWLEDVAEAMAVAARLGDRVVLMGTSTGATLALWAATRPAWRARLEALILLSPNLGPNDPRASLLLWPWGSQLLRLVEGPIRRWEPANELQGFYWTTSYPSSVLLTVMATVRMVEGLPLERVDIPLWMARSADDQVVSVPAMVRMFDRYGAQRKREFVVDDAGDPSHHVLAGDVLSPSTTLRLVDEIVRFVNPRTPSP